MLSVLVEDLVNIYENRVTARLIDRLLEYVDDRLKDLNKITDFIEQAQKYQNACRGSFWKEDRLYTELGELYTDQGHGRVIITLHFLRELERKLLALRGSNLYRAVPQRAEVSISLRKTNILANDQHYRHVADLWRIWAKWYQNRVRTKAQVNEESQRVCSCFDEYAALLIAKSLSSLGFESSADLCPSPGSGPAFLEGPWGALSCQSEDDGSITLTSADWPCPLRFVAIPELLTTSIASTVTAESKLNTIDRDAGVRRRGALVVLYPGNEAERRRFPSSLRRRFHALWSERIPGKPAPTSLLAVGPLVIDSMEDVARAINLWRAEGQLACYPPSLQCPALLISNIVSVYLDIFTHLGHGTIEIRRPVSSHEWEHLRSALRRVSADGERSFTSQAIDDVIERLRDVVGWYAKVLLCPVCGTRADERLFRPLDRNTYRVSCNHCSAAWGLRQCRCGKAYPFLQVHTTASNLHDSDRSFSRGLGRDVFAIPCSRGISDTFVCPHCGDCGKISQAIEACVRCRAG